MKTSMNGKLLQTLAVLALAGLLLFPIPSAFAGSGNGNGATTWTQHYEVTNDIQPSADSCTGQEGTLTQSWKGFDHVTITPNGAFHFHGTFMGDFEFVPYDPEAPIATGRFRTETSDHFNSTGETHLWNLKVKGTRTDGTEVIWHQLWHATVNANGELVVDFYELRCAD